VPSPLGGRRLGQGEEGDRLLLVAFGAGLTSGAIALEWTADPAASARRRHRPGDVKVLPGYLDPSIRFRPRWSGCSSGPNKGVRNDRSDRQDRLVTADAWHRQSNLPQTGRQGADVAFIDVGRRKSPRRRREIEALDARALFIAADVTDPDACVKAVGAVVAAFGKIDILVNNAGSPATT